MAPLSSAESLQRDLAAHAETLHALARESIRAGLDRGAPGRVEVGDYPAELRQEMASFVTLRQGADLRGCVGTAYAHRPLVEDVSHNAFHAAFSDPRFRPLAHAEFAAIEIELSLLTTPEPLEYDEEDDLAARLVPGRDGLILEHRGKRGLFLPQVWETLPDRRAFLHHLKDKAGLPNRPLDRAVRAMRFETVKLALPARSPCAGPFTE